MNSCRSYPGADCGSDHNSVIGSLKVNLKSKKEKKITTTEKDMRLLTQDSSLQEKYRVAVSNKYAVLTEESDQVEEEWKTFKEVLLSTAEEIIPRKVKKKKQQWMTEEILQLMEKRREIKQQDMKSYTKLNEIIKEMCMKAKEKWWIEQCKEIEQNPSQASYKIKEICKENICCA